MTQPSARWACEVAGRLLRIAGGIRGSARLKRPDLFIVGAFKAGTTAMYEYLRVHPQVFMSVPKEPMYFGADLTPRYRRMTDDEYLALFTDATPDQRAGEASPWYLYSKDAPREIFDFAPSAQAIVLLRNPVDVMYAQHSQLVFNRREDIVDFGEALAAEDDRLAGRRIPSRCPPTRGALLPPQRPLRRTAAARSRRLRPRPDALHRVRRPGRRPARGVSRRRSSSWASIRPTRSTCRSTTPTSAPDRDSCSA